MSSEKQNISQDMPITTIDLDMTNNCVLACDYCFRGEKNPRRLTYEVGTKAIDWLIAESGRQKKLSVALFGGEPLIVSRQEKWHSMRHKVRRDHQVFSCMQENT